MPHILEQGLGARGRGPGKAHLPPPASTDQRPPITSSSVTLSLPAAKRVILIGGALGSAYTQLTQSPATLEFARVILLEAALSFLGLGAPREVPSWGAMLADGGDYLATSWWPATIPGLALTLTVLGANLVGDWIQDALDPQLRNRSTQTSQ